MISFYPGPSRVYSQVPDYVQDAYREGILGVNHRSEPFMNLVSRVRELLREKLGVPEDYWLFFTSSATECWEIIGQSLVRQKSFHIYNGAFGEKWQKYMAALDKETASYVFNREEELIPQNLSTAGDVDLIAITQNETANGTQVANDTIGAIQKKWPDPLLAVDATSSMAGINLDFKNADIWFASVQKCFGLPAGMALMVCSPRTVERALAIGEKSHYNSFGFMVQNMRKNQTTHTPNVLDIYLLARVMENTPEIAAVSKKIKQRQTHWEELFAKKTGLNLLIANAGVRSATVVAIQGASGEIAKIKKSAYDAGFILGSGYGALKAETFRIANFPAIEEEEIEQLTSFFENQ